MTQAILKREIEPSVRHRPCDISVCEEEEKCDRLVFNLHQLFFLVSISHILLVNSAHAFGPVRPTGEIQSQPIRAAAGSSDYDHLRKEGVIGAALGRFDSRIVYQTLGEEYPFGICEGFGFQFKNSESPKREAIHTVILEFLNKMTHRGGLTPEWAEVNNDERIRREYFNELKTIAEKQENRRLLLAEYEVSKQLMKELHDRSGLEFDYDPKEPWRAAHISFNSYQSETGKMISVKLFTKEGEFTFRYDMRNLALLKGSSAKEDSLVLEDYKAFWAREGKCRRHVNVYHHPRKYQETGNERYRSLGYGGSSYQGWRNAREWAGKVAEEKKKNLKSELQVSESGDSSTTAGQSQ